MGEGLPPTNPSESESESRTMGGGLSQQSMKREKAPHLQSQCASEMMALQAEEVVEVEVEVESEVEVEGAALVVPLGVVFDSPLEVKWVAFAVPLRAAQLRGGVEELQVAALL